MDNGTFANHPQLEGLPRLVQQQRRLTAGQIRISKEEGALRDLIRQLMDAAGVDAVTCQGFDIRACSGRDGRDTVRVSPVRE
jgi:hypothetical protein